MRRGVEVGVFMAAGNGHNGRPGGNHPAAKAHLDGVRWKRRRFRGCVRQGLRHDVSGKDFGPALKISITTPKRAHALAELAARGFDPERDMLHVPPLLNACKQRDDRLSQIACSVLID